MKKAKKHKKAKNRSKANANDLMLYEHPFASADQEKLKAALLSLALQKAEDFQSSILELQGLLKRSFPLHILGTMSYALLVGVGAKGVSSKSMLSRIQQHHVELLQSLALTVELDDWGKDPLVPTEMQKVPSLVTCICSVNTA